MIDDEAAHGAVDRWLEATLLPDDPALEAALAAGRTAGLPPIDVSPLQGRLLHLLARAVGARRILEIGTLAGYSTICLARALPTDGRLLSLEVSERHASVARANLQAAGVADVAEVVVGPAAETLARLVEGGEPPFDLVFIDADKRSNRGYVRRALELSHPGTLILVDNVVRGGGVADPADSSEDVVGTRDALEVLGSDPRVDATALQTVGVKGWDGLAVALVTG